MKNKSRFLVMALVGVLVSFLLKAIAPMEEKKFGYGILSSVIITFLVWEGNIWLDYFIDQKFPWLKNPGKRILIQLPVSMIYSTAAIYFPMLIFNRFVCVLPEESKEYFMMSSIVIGMLITLIILSVEAGAQFFKHWKTSLVEVEKYKAESLQAQLQNLKDQVNPHFLFNNLSVLTSLVYLDQDKAVEFINQLSKVYRYVLDNRENELVTLETEMQFISSYTYLFKIRFDTNINFYFDISESTKKMLIPPMALQILVENTIKHNEISLERPLQVSIVAFEDELSVINNYQPRLNPEPSSNTGLNNIRSRYKHFTDREISVIHADNKFQVKIPLLKEQ